MKRLTLLVLLLLSSGSVLAQLPLPNVPVDFLERNRQLQGDTVRFCVLQDMVLTGLNESVAREIGQLLLLDTTIHRVEVPYHVQPLGYRSPLSPEQLFFLLNNECDGFMGYLYGVGTYPEWLTTSIPYLDTGFVLVTTDPDVSSLAQVPYGSRVGTQLGSAPNSRFLNLVRNRPDDQTWRRIPYPDNQVLLERVADGTLDAALAWEPAVAAFADPELHVSNDLQPLPQLSARFVITLVSGDAYLQSALDAAITAMKADGSLQNLISESLVPASVPR